MWRQGRGKINGVMEIVEEEDWEGIIPVEGWEGMPYSIFRCHQGFTTWQQLKDKEAKQLPADNGGS